MKHLFFCALLSVAALLGSQSIIAQNAHFISGPCVSSDGRTVSAVIAGLGQGRIDVEVSGDFDCINPGSNEPPAWQDFDLSKSFDKKNGGNFTLTFTLSSLCNKKWTFRVQNLHVTIKAQGAVVLESDVTAVCN